MFEPEYGPETMQAAVAPDTEISDTSAETDVPETAAEIPSDVPAENTGLSGYMSYTSVIRPAVPARESDVSEPEKEQTDEADSQSRDWMAYASIVGGALSVYSSPMVFSGVLLGVSAIVIGILGYFGRKRTLSIIGILAGLAGVVLSVLLGSLYVELFRILSSYLAGGFGFRVFSGW